MLMLDAYAYQVENNAQRSGQVAVTLMTDQDNNPAALPPKRHIEMAMQFVFRNNLRTQHLLHLYFH